MRKEVLAVGCALMVFCGCGKNNAAQHYESGWAAMDYTTAVNEFQQVIDQNSRLAESYRAEGIAYYSEKAYPEAIAAFSRSLNNMDDPDKEFKKDVQFYLAQARMDYGEVDKAIEVYSEILKAGEDEQAFFLRGKAYISMEDYKNAEKDFQRALEGCEDYNLYINIYQIYVDHNKAVDGDAYLKMALELEPQDGEDCYHRGRIYEYEKNYEAARDEWNRDMRMPCCFWVGYIWRWKIRQVPDPCIRNICKRVSRVPRPITDWQCVIFMMVHMIAHWRISHRV